MIDPSTGEELLKKARKKGATEADLVMVESRSFDVRVRLGKLEQISQAEGKKLGLRLFFGKRTSISATSDFSAESLESLLSQTCDMARAAEEDPFSGLPPAEEMVKKIPDLDLDDPDLDLFKVEEKISIAKRTEEAALSFSPEIGNSEGAEFSHSRSHIWYMNSHGFHGDFPSASSSISVSPIAKRNGEMQRDYWFSYGRKHKKLDSPEAVGKRAAERALARLGARKIKTCEAPVIFDPEMAGGLLGTLFSAVAGSSLYRGASFLVGRLGSSVASSMVNITDDGTIPGGPGSRPFDGEGLPVSPHSVIENGVLVNYLLDSYSARKLNMKSTGNASRSIGDGPSAGCFNFFMKPGKPSSKEIISSVKSGLYLTETIGFGINLATGDYSRGAAGYWIENGALAYPVEEITIAGNLKDMLLNIEMVGSDLEMRSSISAPTIKISKMIIAGS